MNKQDCEIHRIVPAKAEGYRWRCIVCNRLFKIAPSSVKVPDVKVYAVVDEDEEFNRPEKGRGMPWQ